MSFLLLLVLCCCLNYMIWRDAYYVWLTYAISNISIWCYQYYSIKVDFWNFVVLCYSTLSYVMLCYVMLYSVALCWITLHHVLLFHFTWFYGMSCFAVLYTFALCCVFWLSTCRRQVNTSQFSCCIMFTLWSYKISQRLHYVTHSSVTLHHVVPRHRYAMLW